MADAVAFFFRLGVVSSLGRYFCLPEVPRCLLESLGLKFNSSSHRPWYPHSTVLPMGWDWSFYLALHVRLGMLRRSTVISMDRVVVDFCLLPSLETSVLFALPYCGYIHVGSTCPVKAAAGLKAVKDSFIAHAFVIHKELEPSAQSSSLGFDVGGESGWV